MLLETTKLILKQQGWQFYDLNDETLRLDIDGKATTWSTIIKCVDEHRQLIIYSICPNKVEIKKLGVMQEFLTRANFGLKFGNFELDLSDGEVRFKTSIQFVGEVELGPMIAECLSLNVITFDRYLSGILQVMFTDVIPEDAIATIEYSKAQSSST